MDGKRLPNGFPVLVDAGAPPPVRYAAAELSKYFARMDRRPHPVLEDSSAIGVRLRLSREGMPNGAFRLSAGEGNVLIEAGSPSGVVYGACAALERLGCRFLAPDCEVVPEGEIVFPRADAFEKPAFEVRELFWREAMDGAFAVKLKLNSSRSSITPEQGGKAMFFNFSHSFNRLVPPEEWFDSHPEYFSMVDGRRLRERTQLCLTNPDVLRICIDRVRGWIVEHPEYDIFSVAMNDWYNNCRCPDCLALDEAEGSGAGTMIHFVNRIADSIAEDFPRMKIHTFAYLYCRKPPRRVRPRDNVIVRLCSIECCFLHPIGACGRETGPIDVQSGRSERFDGQNGGGSAFLEDLRGWAAICKNLCVWDYTTNYANYLQPFPNLRVLAPNLRLFRDHGVKGVFEQGNFSLGRAGALGPLKIYLLGKLLWDPDLDEGQLTDEFVRGYFGPASPQMREYVSVWSGVDGPGHAGIYDPPDAPYLTVAVLERARALLNEALRAAPSEPFAGRVGREALSVEYVELAREPPGAPGRAERINAFEHRLSQYGVTELFERRALKESVDALRSSRLAADRESVPTLSYPL